MAAVADACCTAATAYINEPSWLTPRTVRKTGGQASPQHALGEGLARRKRYDSVRRLLDEDDDDPLESVVKVSGTAAAAAVTSDSDMSREATPLNCVSAAQQGCEGIPSARALSPNQSQGSASSGVFLQTSRMKNPNGIKEWIRSSAFDEFPEKTRPESSPATLAGGDHRFSIGLLIMQDIWGAFYVAAKVAGRCVLVNGTPMDAREGMSETDALFISALPSSASRCASEMSWLVSARSRYQIPHAFLTMFAATSRAC